MISSPPFILQDTSVSSNATDEHKGKIMSMIVKWRENDELVTLPKPMFVCSIFIVLFKIKK